MRRLPVTILLLVAAFLATAGVAAAQSRMVASLEVLSAQVSVKPAGAELWTPIRVETLIRAGDTVRTNRSGKARITFFESGAAVVLEPNTEYTIVEFSSSANRFSLTVELLLGITRQQFGRLLDPGSHYRVITPGAAMTVRGTDFGLRVEEDGRSAVITFEGLLEATAEGNTAEVPPGFGLRSEVGGPLSHLVPATTFAELDVALDGCSAQLTSGGDVRLNVRIGPERSFERIGSVSPAQVAILIGRTAAAEWYRIPFRDGFGWVAAAALEVRLGERCEIMPVYGDDRVEEGPSYIFDEDLVIAALVKAPAANLRSGPGLGYPRVGSAVSGDELIVIGRNRDGTWLQVGTADGEMVWIAAFLVHLYADLETVSEVILE